jgi:hypothetical protein
MKVLYIILVFTLSFEFVSFSQTIPQTLNYQGILKDGSGVILPDGSYSLTFKLYNAASGGSALWTETKSVTVQDGVFATQLGNTTQINLPFTEGYYLGVTVAAGSELTPRFPLSSVPYSFMSLNVPDGSVTATKIANGEVVKSLNGLKDAVTLVAGSNVTITPNGNNLTISSAGGGSGGIGGSGTPGYIPIFTDATSIGNSSAFQIGAGDFVINNVRFGLGGGSNASNIAIGGFALENNTYGHENIAIGPSALKNNIGGNNNIAIGRETMSNNTGGYSNTALGSVALRGNTSGYGNTAIGWGTLVLNTTGIYNTAIGFNTMGRNTIGENNTSVGESSLYFNTTGNNNSALGSGALQSNTTGGANTALGFQSLFFSTEGSNNTATGYKSLYSNTSGTENTANGNGALYSNTTGYMNTATGMNSLYSNTTGRYNTAVGESALYSNTAGNQNTAIGTEALTTNISGIGNSATGHQALNSNTTGDFNTANGSGALFYNTTGYSNTGVGRGTLLYNTTGNENTAIGYSSLVSNTTGYQNTTVGVFSMTSIWTGSYNTALGYNTGPNGAAQYNTTCLGIDATATGNNMVRIGNTFVTSIGGQVSWSTLSDGRFKENVNEDVPGLSFITQLRPVTYQINKEQFNQFTKVYEKGTDKEENGIQISQRMESTVPSERVTGFIAQEVEQIANNLGYDFSGIDKPENSNDYYGLRYAEFVVPLVKALQEQQKIIEELTKRIEALEGR